MNKAITLVLFVFATVYSNTPAPAIEPDTNSNSTEFTGKRGIVTCPKPADVKSLKGNNCRTKQNVMKELMENVAKCKYLLNNKKGISSFKGSATIYFQITTDGYIMNYKVLKSDIKQKMILLGIENQIKAAQFGKAGRDCVSEITCNFKLKVLAANSSKQ